MISFRSQNFEDENFTDNKAVYKVRDKVPEHYVPQKLNNNYCDWILENRPKCHTWLIALSWPS